MPIYDQKATPFMEQLKVAGEAEAEAITTLHSYLKNGENNMEKVKEFTEKMESTHNEKMRIYQEMQQFRIDIL